MTSKSSKPAKIAAVLAALMLVGVGCASQGPTDDPIQRKLQWFSYLEGGDFRARCGPGAPDRYRLVYNGVYLEQVRAYDLYADGDLEVRVTEETDLTNFTISSVRDLLKPWRGETTSMPLTSGEMNTLIDALTRDGAFGPPAVGTELSSKGFFWTIASCHDGDYHFTGLAWPSDAWGMATFDDVLFALDPSHVPVNPPRNTETTRFVRQRDRSQNDNAFRVRAGENGLAGTFTIPH